MLLMKMWIGRDSVIQLNNGESWTLFMLLFDFGCQMMSSLLSVLKWKNVRHNVYIIYFTFSGALYKL